ncbi:MAG: DUF4381 domain-containing protein [Magnetococcus sp. DMHC-6]
MNPEIEKLLAQLQPIHPPEPISFWPPAPGWWGLAALLFIASPWLFFRLRRFFQARRPIREALIELEQIAASYQKNQDGLQLLQKLSVLLRRVAMQRYGRPATAALTGQKWLAFLDQTGQTKAFSQGAGELLASGPYRLVEPDDPNALLAIVRAWIRAKPMPLNNTP